jgi:hypothetical protein
MEERGPIDPKRKSNMRKILQYPYFKHVVVTFVVGLIICFSLNALDAYARTVVTDVVEQQIEDKSDEIDGRLKIFLSDAVAQALEKKETQEKIKAALREAVTVELEQNPKLQNKIKKILAEALTEELDKNSDKYIDRAIKKKFPEGIPPFFEMPNQEKSE